MSSRTPRVGCALALLALGLLALLGAQASASPTPGFEVAGTVVFERQSLEVEGAITVLQGGHLTLNAVDLALTSGPSGPAALVVKPGGKLTVVDSTLRGDAGGFRFSIFGAADVRRTTVLGLAADASMPMGRPLAGGFQIPFGGVLLASSDVRFEDVSIRGAEGCALTVEGAAPVLEGLKVSDVAYRTSGTSGFAAGVCVVGGSPTIAGLRLASIGTGAQGEPTHLKVAGLVADAPYRLVLRNLDLQGFAPALAGLPSPHSVAVLIEEGRFVTVSGGTIRGTTDGIVQHGSPAGPEGSSATIEDLLIHVASGPISEQAPFNTDPLRVYDHLQITGCGANGILFESQPGGTATTVTATISNSSATSCGQNGFNMYNSGSSATHYFNVWDSNASTNGQRGYWLHGVNQAAGLNVQMANNEAWRNNWAGIVVEGTYNGAAGKFASAKLFNNTARNNSLIASSYNGGILLGLGQPTTLSLRYDDNVATGNGQPGGSDDYGHYISVAVFSAVTVPAPGYLSNNYAHSNSEYGFALFGGATVPLQVRVRDATIINHSRVGLVSSNSRIEVWTSTMANQKEFEGTNAAFFLMGTVHNRLSGTTTGIVKIISYKQVCLHGSWQNGAPLYLIPLTFTSGSTAATMYSDVSVDPPTAAAGRQTNANGDWSGWTLDWTFDPQAPAGQNTVDYAPFSISVQIFETSATAGPFNLYNNVCGDIEFVDPNPPFVTVATPLPDHIYTKSNLTVQGTVVDDLSGLAGLQLSLGGVLWVDITLAGGGPFSYTFVGIADGLYDLYVRAWDRANNGLDPRNETLITLVAVGIDTVAPAIDLLEPPLCDGCSFWTSNDTIFFRGRIDASVELLYVNGEPVSVVGTSFLYIGNLPNEGPQSFLFLAIDGAGNAKSLKVTIFKDRLSPTVIVDPPLCRGDLYISSHSIEVRGSTDQNVVVSVNGQVAALSGTAFSSTVTLLEGRNVINITAVDAADNRAQRLCAVVADTVAPVISLASHHEGDFLNSSRIELAGGVSEAVALFEVNLRIFRVSTLDFTAVLGLAEGKNLLSLRAIDRAGNVGRFVLNVTVDTIAPVIEVVGLTDFGTGNQAHLTAVGSLSEDGTLTVDLQDVDVVDLQFDTAITLHEGSNTITFVATDLAGNRGTLVRHLTLDTLQPTLSITEPSPTAVLHSRTVHIVGSTEPNAVIEVGGQRVQADASGRFSAWVDLQGDGAQSIAITVTDAAGNSYQEGYGVTYAPAVVDTGADLMVGLGLLVALAAGLAIATMFLARKRVDAEVEVARAAKGVSQETQAATPGYTEQQPGYADPAQVYAEAQPAYGEPPAYGYPDPGPSYAETSTYAPAEPAPQAEPAASQPAPPRPPRPLRPPSN